MKRRDFTKLMITSVAGVSVLNTKSKTIQMQNQSIKLGGPIFKKYNNPDEWIQALKLLNYKAAYCPVSLDADSNEIKAYKEAAQKSGIIIAEVGAWSNPIDPDQEKSNTAIQKCIKSLQLADEIGANCCVNVSGSRNPEAWAGPHKDNLTPETFDLIVETTRKIIDAVKPNHAFFTIETMPWAYPDSVESYEKLLKAIDRKQLGVHFDPVNLISNPQVYYKNGEMIKKAFKKFGNQIKSCHAKDILLDDKLTVHLSEVRAGLGNLNYAVFLKELSKLNNIPLMLEHLSSEEDYKLAADYVRGVAKLENISL